MTAVLFSHSPLEARIIRLSEGIHTYVREQLDLHRRPNVGANNLIWDTYTGQGKIVGFVSRILWKQLEYVSSRCRRLAVLQCCGRCCGAGRGLRRGSECTIFLGAELRWDERANGVGSTSHQSSPNNLTTYFIYYPKFSRAQLMTCVRSNPRTMPAPLFPTGLPSEQSALVYSFAFALNLTGCLPLPRTAPERSTTKRGTYRVVNRK